MSNAERFDEDEHMIKIALGIESGMGEKTLRFVESLGRWVLDYGKQLTPKQRASLEKILEQHGR